MEQKSPAARIVHQRRFAAPPVLASILAAASSIAAAADVEESLLQKDFPFQGACINADFPADNVALKGLAIRVGTNASVLFDTDLCRLAAGWTGGFITTHGVAFDGAHGQHPAINGSQVFGVAKLPGVAGPDGRFTDTRKEPYGPIDKSVVHWNGLYVNGMNVLLTYTVNGSVKVSEQPGTVYGAGEIAFTRTFKLESAPAGGAAKVAAPFSIRIADVDGASSSTDGAVVTLSANGKVTKVAGVDLPKNASLKTDGGAVILQFAKGAVSKPFRIVIWSGPEANASHFAALITDKVELADFSHGGPRRWTQEVNVKGTLATSATPDGAYATDVITTPEKNPWNRRVRFGGFDFFSDGKRAAFCTHDGDVWIVSGLDESLNHITWRRFASGMYETLGLAIVNDVIYTAGRDQVTRYTDLNNDGEADFYENFNNDILSSEGFHEFVFDLQRDDAGNFYFAKANPVNAGGRGFGDKQASRGNGSVSSHAGCLFKLSADGQKLEVLARGLRAPNGIGVRGDGQVTTSDNEGTWVPSTPINWISKPGQFCGVVNNLTPPDLAAKWTPPLAWVAHSDWDNSGGGQVWVTSDKWGPFKGEMLHESYGKSSLFLVMKESIGDGRYQGGVVRFPLRFTSSVMRAHFNPVDGQLYIAGLSEWQSNAGRITGFDRVRYTGRPVVGIKGLKVVAGGVQLSFTTPIDKASASDLQNWSGKRWNYERAEHYGSPEFRVKNPRQQGREPLEITSAKVSDDGTTVTLGVSDIRPVMQQSIKWDIKAADGTPIQQEIQHTIHVVPGSNLN
jgi:hypothetical protein